MKLLKKPIAYGTPVRITGGLFKGKQGLIFSTDENSLFGFGKRDYTVRKDTANGGKHYFFASEEDITPLYDINEYTPESWQYGMEILLCKLRHPQNGPIQIKETITVIEKILAKQNATIAEKIRRLKIVPVSIPHGSPYITAVNVTAEAAARLVEIPLTDKEWI